VFAVDATSSKPTKRLHRLLNKTKATTTTTTTITITRILAKTNNQTNTTDVCEAEVIDENLYYFSVGYRVFAGALVVPITICAICGNILVIYVIKRYASLRVTGNVFLASLAVADVGVSTLAMTFYGLQLLKGRWLFGAVSLIMESMNVNFLKKSVVFFFLSRLYTQKRVRRFIRMLICAYMKQKNASSRNEIVVSKIFFFLSFITFKDYFDHKRNI
jgi:hypothetical protein